MKSAFAGTQAPSSRGFFNFGAISPQELSALEQCFLQGRFAEAEALARSLNARDPQHPLVWKILAATIATGGDLDTAIALYQQAPASLHDDWQYHNNYGNALKGAGRRGEAIRHYERAIALHQDSIEPFYNLGVTLLEMGNLTAAESKLRFVLTMDPDHGLTHGNLANILNMREQLEEADLHYRCAVRVMPQEVRLLNNYGQLLSKQHRYPEAEAYYRRAIELDANFAPPFVNLGELMGQHGFVAETEMLLRHALKIDPNLAQGHSNLLFTLALRDNCTPTAILAEHRAYAAQFETPLKSHWGNYLNTRDPDRILHIGFVSGDFRNHPVVRYLMPALQRLVQYDGLQLYAYNASRQHDAYTAQYQELFHYWRGAATASDAALARAIRADVIDILFDLSGHSGDNRMLTFAHKPAPLQMSWIGYVATTGLEAMDYFVGDANLITPAEQSQFAEKILYLPATTSFDPHEPAPERNALPALTKEYFTFCCLARINKLNQAHIALWARVLKALPRSRMMLATMSNGSAPETVKAWFAAEGIQEERLLFLHSRSVLEQLEQYRMADLCLDTFPYNGSTTISHALCMGVPTLTLRGDLVSSRLGTSIASHVGIPEFIAHDRDEFVQKAMFWTQNLQALNELREKLPAMFAASALRQHDQLVETLVQKLRLAWQRWCEGLPPVTF
ncbi:O-linked N-acetylglucosamine transferase, SPINDLY family protein [Terriglobus albidus]|uniref:O-linked N-acetylglucosamine transferase, SPINDLY family protein n=1 Tax=Terriglobus albidus TaxID=1592106 RepID=UPI0021DFEF5A|nr:tetratricopeptide repeat protein [Terriglobus albidus]